MRIAASIFAGALLCFSTAAAVADQGKSSRGSKEDQEACTPDVYRLCQAQIPDEDRIVACLRANRGRLSPACRKVFE